MRLRDEPKDAVFTIEMPHCLRYNVNNPLVLTCTCGGF